MLAYFGMSLTMASAQIAYTARPKILFVSIQKMCVLHSVFVRRLAFVVLIFRYNTGHSVDELRLRVGSFLQKNLA